MARQRTWRTHATTSVSTSEPGAPLDLLDDTADNGGRTLIRVIGGWSGLYRSPDEVIRTARMRLGIARHPVGQPPDVTGSALDQVDWLYYVSETLKSTVWAGESIQQVDVAGQLARIDTQAARRLTTGETVSVVTVVDSPPDSSWSAGAYFFRCLVLEPD